MSELDELINELDKKFHAGDMTDLDLCVYWWHVQQVPIDVADRATIELAELRAALDEARNVIVWYADADNYCHDIAQSYLSTAYQTGRLAKPAAAWLKANLPTA